MCGKGILVQRQAATSAVQSLKKSNQDDNDRKLMRVDERCFRDVAWYRGQLEVSRRLASVL